MRRPNDDLLTVIHRVVIALLRHIAALMSTRPVATEEERHRRATDELDTILRELLTK